MLNYAQIKLIKPLFCFECDNTERQNIQIVTNPGQGKRLTEADLREISQAQTTHKALLQIPRR